MPFFLEQLAQYHLKNHLTEISDFCFVFPSQRAGVFFRKHLSDQTTNPIWSPRIMTISDFFAELEPQPVSDNISLIFKLYEAYKQVIDPSMSLDEFIPWGEMCLSDFDDIDKYLADAGSIFRNLAELKALEDDFSHLSTEQIEAIRTFWSTFNPKKYSGLQNSFLKIWEKLPQLYATFNAALDSANEAYEGKLYRSVAQKIKDRTLPELRYKRVVFAGFNALNKCEKVLFNHLKIKQQASFFWDYPEWVVQKNRLPNATAIQHEAARFIVINLNDFPMPSDWENPLPASLPEITLATAANDLAQTQIAGAFLESQAQTDETGQATRTALVLADESLLLPAIHAVPPRWGKINVTLGYPLKNTPAYGLLEALMLLQRSTRITRQGKVWFYHRHLTGLLRHQYIRGILKEEGTQLLEDLIKGNQIFIEKEQLPHNPLLEALLVPVKNSRELSAYLSSALTEVYQSVVGKPQASLEQEFIYHLYLNIKRLGEILAGEEVVPEKESWHRLFKKLADFQTVPFNGEPLSGLQVMGILETRALDFDHLTILSMNEGIFPHTAPPNSFIPFNLRIGYGLPTINNQDSIFAYYFYRLIHRAKTVTLVWSSSNAQKQAGEMSRFLHQLFYEYPHPLKINTYVQPASTQKELQIRPLKNREVMQQLSQYLKPGQRFLSPSALSTYIECPLRFYFKYLAGAREPEAISEDLDPRTFGNLFHKTVEKIYSPLINQLVREADLQKLTDTGLIQKRLEEVFAENVPFIKQKSNLFADLQGKNTLVYEVLLRYLRRFFKLEALAAPFTIKALEAQMKMIFSTPGGLEINLGGNIDRLDEKEGEIRVIDYKTGGGDNRIGAIDELFDTTKHAKKKAIFQTLLYSLMVTNRDDNENQISPHVIWMKNLFGQDFNTSLYLQPPKQEKREIKLADVREEFSEHLGALLNELFDDQIPFEQTPHLENCRYCIYREICLR